MIKKTIFVIAAFIQTTCYCMKTDILLEKIEKQCAFGIEKKIEKHGANCANIAFLASIGMPCICETITCTCCMYSCVQGAGCYCCIAHCTTKTINARVERERQEQNEKKYADSIKKELLRMQKGKLGGVRLPTNHAVQRQVTMK